VQWKVFYLVWRLRQRTCQVRIGFDGWLADLGIDPTILYGKLNSDLLT